jgi:hypothetical protein
VVIGEGSSSFAFHYFRDFDFLVTAITAWYSALTYNKGSAGRTGSPR